MINQQKITFDISVWAIIKVLAVIFGIWFLVSISEILLLFYIVLVMVAALSPVVDKWSKKTSRIVAISMIYLLMLLGLLLVMLLIVPPLITEIQNLIQTLPDMININLPQINDLRSQLDTSSQNISGILGQVTGLTSQVYNATVGVFGGLFALFTVIVLSFYLLLEEQGAKKLIQQYLPLEEKEKVAEIVSKIGLKMGGWLRGQLLLGLIIGTIDGVGLAALGVPYVLTLAVWAGFTELIPYVGPVLGAIPAVLLAFSVSPIIGFLTIVLYVLVQQIEANFLVPKIMQKAVGLSPVIIILALLVGGKVAGLLGVILAIPTAVIISVLSEEIPHYGRRYNERKKNGQETPID